MAPQAVAAAVVAAGTQFAVGVVLPALAVSTTVLISTFVTTLALTGLSMALQKKPKINPQGSMAARSQMVKQPLMFLYLEV